MFRNIMKAFNRIQHKIFISFVGITILSLFFFGYISLYLSKASLEEQTRLSKMRNLAVVTEKLDIMIDSMISLSNVYFGSSELRYLLMTPTVSGSYEQKLMKEFVYRMIVNYKYAFTWLDYHVSIFGFNGVEMHSLYEGEIGLEALTDQPWYDEVQKRDGSVYLLHDASPELAKAVGEDHYVSIARMLKDYESGQTIGLFIISVKESFLFNQIKSSIEEYESIMLTDAAGHILTANDKSWLGTRVSDHPFASIVDQTSDRPVSIKFEGLQHMVTTGEMPKTDWQFYIFSPYDKMFAKMNQVQFINWLIFFIIITLSLLLSYLIARKLSIPIQSLYTDMNKVEKGDLTVRSHMMSNDEIGSLAYRFNRMVSRIQDLHQEVIAQQEKKRRAEIEALQSQINAHFLFNTLASVRYMVITGDAQQADSVIVSLVKLLKKTLSRKSEFILIQEEIDHLKHYLNIQKARMQDSFEVEWHIDPDILQFQTLGVLLQPIVENALFHGIEPMHGTGIIRIKGYRNKERIYIEILDNGDGFSTREGTGMGIKNIRHRLNMHFGDEAGLKLERLEEQWTQVTLYFPVFRNEKELTQDERGFG